MKLSWWQQFWEWLDGQNRKEYPWWWQVQYHTRLSFWRLFYLISSRNRSARLKYRTRLLWRRVKLRNTDQNMSLPWWYIRKTELVAPPLGRAPGKPRPWWWQAQYQIRLLWCRIRNLIGLP